MSSAQMLLLDFCFALGLNLPLGFANALGESNNMNIAGLKHWLHAEQLRLPFRLFWERIKRSVIKLGGAVFVNLRLDHNGFEGHEFSSF